MSRFRSSAPLPVPSTRSLRVAAVVTPHGYGHAAITMAVLEALGRRVDLEVIFVTPIGESVLRRTWRRPCRVVAHRAPTDFGMLMKTATEVRVPDSVEAYKKAHAVWESVVLGELRPNIVLTSISYAALAAARRLEIPAVGVGPFTWREILRAYAGSVPDVAPVLTVMEAAYRDADTILATTPAVSIDLPNVRRIGPVARPGKNRRRDLERTMGLGPHERVALVALGGVPEALPVENWPLVPGWRWLVPDGPATKHPAVLPLADSGLSVADAVASCDAVITKPGYGTFVETACAGTPVLYRARPEWPETEGLARWASQYVPCVCVDHETFSTGCIESHLRMLLGGRHTRRAEPTGNAEATEIIMERLAHQGLV